MKLELIKIGNSQGLRIPKAILEQCGFGKTVRLHIQKDGLLISPDAEVRHEWEAAFQEMAAHQDDVPVIAEGLHNEFDADEWAW